MYGKKSMGIIRSTFLIDKDGILLKKWTNVKAKGHAEKVKRSFGKFLVVFVNLNPMSTGICNKNHFIICFYSCRFPKSLFFFK